MEPDRCRNGTFQRNPIRQPRPDCSRRIPIISVCGDSDQTVPYKENMDVVRSRYLAAGGPVEVILKKECDHHPHSLDNPEPVVDFILRQQPEYEKYIHYNVRGSLQNSFRKFEKERRARVAFLGGSITEMDGWRNMIERQLQQRFPYTQFEWVEAGIGSTGTTPGSFRLQHDILSKGKSTFFCRSRRKRRHERIQRPRTGTRHGRGSAPCFGKQPGNGYRHVAFHL